MSLKVHYSEADAEELFNAIDAADNGYIFEHNLIEFVKDCETKMKNNTLHEKKKLSELFLKFKKAFSLSTKELLQIRESLPKH